MDKTAQQYHLGTMAYHPHRDDEFKDDQLDYGGVSLAGIIKLQPSRKKGNKLWRPMQTSDVEDSDTSNGDVSFHFGDAEDINVTTVGSIPHYAFDKAHTGSFPPSQAQYTCAHIGDMYDGASAVENLASITQDGIKVARYSDTHYTMVEIREKLFGNLPDPTRIHEQTGKFDGQVVFIGHPNRDISAHQWSLSSFQWVNIGRYSHSRGEVEGSLASDRLQGIDEPYNTLAYFKLAAQNRQSLVIENGRPKDHNTTVDPASHVDTEVMPSSQSCTTASIGSFRFAASRQSEAASLSLIPYRSLIKDTLEDPFVTVANVSIPRSARDNSTQGNLTGQAGSLELTYRFPPKMFAASRPIDRADTLRPKDVRRRTLDCLSAPTLHEVAFGEEAVTQRSVVLANSKQLYDPSSAPLEPAQGGSQHQRNVNEWQSALTMQNSLTQSTANLNPTAFCTDPTRSVAPLTHLASSFSGAAVPCGKAMTVAADSIVSESTVSTVNAAAVGLHYSDPEGLRRTQHYEVANGLNQQAPTPQSFKGPFFTDTKPTTHDPTVALSVRISEEEKLVNWFRDGHRPARQREYTKSLIAAAATTGKTRQFGAIGEACAKQQEGPYTNTGPFVRLYENLSEYVEEYRNGRSQSYFTQRWKPATPQIRDLGFSNNTSYFSKARIQSSWPRGALLKPSERMWV